MIKAILFDMDGVIVDSEPLHFEAHKKAAAQFGIKLTLEDYMKYGVSAGDDALYEKMSEISGMPVDKSEISKIKKQQYRKIFDEKGQMFPGILEALRDFSKRHKLALVSSGATDAIEYVLEKLEIKNYFNLIVCGEDVEKVKPFPDIYLKTLELLDMEPEDCVAIEDSQNGVKAAKGADLRCIAIPNEFTKSQDFSKADMVLASSRELNRELIEKLPC